MPLAERGILFDSITTVWTIRFYHSILTFMKIALLLVAVYALIINQSLKQEKRSISARVNMQSRSKLQNIQQNNNTYLNASFQPALTVRPVQSRGIHTAKKNFPVKLYQTNPFQKASDLKEEIKESTLQDPSPSRDYPSYQGYSGLFPKDGFR